MFQIDQKVANQRWLTVIVIQSGNKPLSFRWFFFFFWYFFPPINSHEINMNFDKENKSEFGVPDWLLNLELFFRNMTMKKIIWIQILKLKKKWQDQLMSNLWITKPICTNMSSLHCWKVKKKSNSFSRRKFTWN